MVELDKIICGDCLEELPAIPEDSIDAICTDPPAGIAFMGKEWDKDKGGRDKWIAWMEEVAFGCLRAVKPGGHALVWALPRTSHWTGMAWENAGWEPRDKISHVFGSGFPKSLDISKALDKMAGAEREVIGKREQPDIRGDSFQNRLRHGVSGNVEILDTLPATPAARQWAGFGTALKPAHEDWWLFRKPLDQPTIASNVLRWGCGGINIDGCRVEMNGETWDKNIGSSILGKNITGNSLCLSKDECFREIEKRSSPLGRFPANLIHDGSQPVLAEFAKAGQTTYSDKRVCKIQRTPRNDGSGAIYGKDTNLDPQPCYSDTGSPARFFQACPFTEEDIPAFLYYAKASKSER